MNERKSRIVRVDVEFPLVFDHDLAGVPFDLGELFAALDLGKVAKKINSAASCLDGTGSAEVKLSETKKDLDISDAWRKAQSKEER